MEMHRKRDQIQSLRSINIQGEEKNWSLHGGGGGETAECAVREIKRGEHVKKDGGIEENVVGFWLLAARRHLLLLMASAPEVQGFIVQKDLLAKGLVLSIWGLMALRQTLIESIKGDLELSTSIPASPYQLLAGCHNSWLPSSGTKC